VLRADPYNVEGWQLAIDLAPDSNSRSQAQVGLERSMAARAQQQPMPQAQPVYYQQPYPPQQPMVVYPPGQMYAQPYRYEKDYIGEALVTLLLYYIGAGVIGFVANLIFLNNAKNDQRRGIITRNVGCLQAILIVNGIVFSVGCVALFFLFLLPILPAMFGGY
jgi:hypothetical protein